MNDLTKVELLASHLVQHFGVERTTEDWSDHARIVRKLRSQQNEYVKHWNLR